KWDSVSSTLPLTTKGQLLGRNASDITYVDAASSNGQILISDGTASTGLTWADIDSLIPLTQSGSLLTHSGTDWEELKLTGTSTNDILRVNGSSIEWTSLYDMFNFTAANSLMLSNGSSGFTELTAAGTGGTVLSTASSGGAPSWTSLTTLEPFSSAIQGSILTYSTTFSWLTNSYHNAAMLNVNSSGDLEWKQYLTSLGDLLTFNGSELDSLSAPTGLSAGEYRVLTVDDSQDLSWGTIETVLPLTSTGSLITRSSTGIIELTVSSSDRGKILSVGSNSEELGWVDPDILFYQAPYSVTTSRADYSSMLASNTGKYSSYSSSISTIAFSAQSSLYNGAVIGPDGQTIYTIPDSSSHILSIDVSASIPVMKKLNIDLDGSDMFSDGILASNNCIYYLPTSAGPILKVNVFTEEYSFIGDFGSGFAGGTIYTDVSGVEYLYAIPNAIGVGYLELNLSTNNMTLAGTTTEVSYVTGVVTSNGDDWLVSGPVNDTFSYIKLGDINDSGSSGTVSTSGYDFYDFTALETANMLLGISFHSGGSVEVYSLQFSLTSATQTASIIGSALYSDSISASSSDFHIIGSAMSSATINLSFRYYISWYDTTSFNIYEMDSSSTSILSTPLTGTTIYTNFVMTNDGDVVSVSEGGASLFRISPTFINNVSSDFEDSIPSSIR
ncbi:hypothetical protein ADUPG1_009059, partial [Aduncisulcus paluster]